MSRRTVIDRVLSRLAVAHAARAAARFHRDLNQVDAAQMTALLNNLARNADGEFGRQHGFDRIRTYADFAGRVPVRNYDQMQPYIDRVRRGEFSALFGSGQRVLMFALTSGTTAEPKYIPVTATGLAEWRRGWNIWGLTAIRDHPGSILRAIVQVTSPMNDHAAPCGVPCGAVTGLLAATQKRLVRRYYTTPLCVADIGDSTAKYYTIMRLAIPRDVAFCVTANPATLLALARCADEHCERMIRDIHDGTLSDHLPVDGAVRAALARRHRPDRQCARRLEGIVAEHGALYPRHYWTLSFLAHWTGGTMGLYRDRMPQYFGDAPVRDIGLLASEGRVTIPVEDGTAAGILDVTTHFYEFIPADEYGSGAPTLVRCDGLEVGQEYFVVMTTSGGLYRYDLGDRVRVTGRAGGAPVLEFLSRDAHTASLAGEKLTEDQVVLAMRRVMDALGIAHVDFVMAPRWDDPPRYRLYVEPTSAAAPDLAARLDVALGRVNIEYRSKRHSGRLGDIELAVLPRGELANRDDRLRAARTRTAEQFKRQYLLARPDQDGDLDRLSERTENSRRAPDPATPVSNS